MLCKYIYIEEEYAAKYILQVLDELRVLPNQFECLKIS